MLDLGIPGSDDKLWLLVACTLECGSLKTFGPAETEWLMLGPESGIKILVNYYPF